MAYNEEEPRHHDKDPVCEKTIQEPLKGIGGDTENQFFFFSFSEHGLKFLLRKNSPGGKFEK